MFEDVFKILSVHIYKIFSLTFSPTLPEGRIDKASEGAWVYPISYKIG